MFQVAALRRSPLLTVNAHGYKSFTEGMAMSGTQHILVVDDHREIRDLVRQLLQQEGYHVVTAADGIEMRRAMADQKIDLVILDLMLPNVDGLTLCRELRAKIPSPGIIMLTAKGEEVDRVLGLEMGADDYLAKPFSGRELLARAKAVLRRIRSPVAAPEEAAPDTYRFGVWRLHTARRELEDQAGVIVPLSTGEYNLLLAFVQRPQRLLTRETLLELARGRQSLALDRSIDIQVSRLRRKIGDDSKNPDIIKTVWGGGYMFAAKVAIE